MSFLIGVGVCAIGSFLFLFTLFAPPNKHATKIDNRKSYIKAVVVFLIGIIMIGIGLFLKTVDGLL
jgi:hypothetical protein